MSNFYTGSVTEENVQDVIAGLLLQFSGDTASARLEQEARFSKQSPQEIAYRTAGNLLRSSVTRKRSGTVYVP